MNTYKYPGQETKRDLRPVHNKSGRTLRIRCLRSRRHTARQWGKRVIRESAHQEGE